MNKINTLLAVCLLMLGASSVNADGLEDVSFSFTSVCQGDPVEFMINSTNSIDSVIWNFNDPLSGSSNLSTSITPQHTFSNSGGYLVELQVFANNETSTIYNDVIIYEIPNASISYDNEVCFGEDISIEYSGQQSALNSYSWNFGSGQIISGNGPGPYYVNWSVPGNKSIELIVTNPGCSISNNKSIQVYEPLEVSMTETDVSCMGEGNGEIDISATGGSMNYSYLWPHNGNETEDIDQLDAGTYSVIITDDFNCTITGITTIDEPSYALDIDIDITGACTQVQTGNIYVNVSGGIPEYEYIWNNNNTDYYQVNVPAGTYSVTVSDQSGCVLVRDINLTPPQQMLSGSFIISDASCKGYSNGSVNLNVSGGYQPYTYIWDNDSTSQDLSDLDAGSYSVSITDDRMCTIVGTATVTEPDDFHVNVSGNDFACYGESLELSASVNNQINGYTFHWNIENLIGSTVHITPNEDFTATVYAVNYNNCISNTSSINIEVGEPLEAVFTVTNEITCPGGENTLVAEISGGDGGPYQSFLEDGSLLSFPYIDYPQETSNLTITTTDECGTQPLTQTVSIEVHEQYIIGFDQDDLNGCTPFTVQFNESGYGEADRIIWQIEENKNAQIITGSNPVFTFTEPGDYDITLTVTDINGCISTEFHENIIHVDPSPVAAMVADRISAKVNTSEVSFKSTSENVYFQTWEFGDGNTAVKDEVSHIYEESGVFQVDLIVESFEGCLDTASTIITVSDETTFYVPTAFTPNSDGKNDEFMVFSNGISDDAYHFAIYDRWGSMVFETNRPDATWNGKDAKGRTLEVGAYTWFASYKDEMNIVNQKSGSITIIL